MTHLRALAIVTSLLAPMAAWAEVASFSVISGGKNVGHLIADTRGATTTIDFDVKDNGRVTRMLHDRGVFLVFGADNGGSFTCDRELELCQSAA